MCLFLFYLYYFSLSFLIYLTRTLNIPTIQVRELNVNVQGQMTPYGQPLEYCSVGYLMHSLRDSVKYDERAASIAAFNANNRWVKKGINLMPLKYGIAWSSYSCGAMVNIYADGTVAVTHSGVEVGQGINTKVCFLIFLYNFLNILYKLRNWLLDLFFYSFYSIFYIRLLKLLLIHLVLIYPRLVSDKVVPKRFQMVSLEIYFIKCIFIFLLV